VSSSVVNAPNRSHAFTAALFQELARSGVKDVCLCPGSRSTPLAVAVVNTPELRCWTHIDERAAAFFALGLAKAGRAPVALVCTSGTAAANFLPAVVEAHHSDVPLLLLTADRPPELRAWGAGQTIDQLHLYGRHVRWFAEVAVPEPGGDALRYARALACRAVAESVGAPAGPCASHWSRVGCPVTCHEICGSETHSPRRAGANAPTPRSPRASGSRSRTPSRLWRRS